jgi:alginate O-acetyltransferase complex protein AlgJ
MPAVQETLLPRFRLTLFVGFFALLCAPVISWTLHCPEPVGVENLRTLAAWPDWHEIPLTRWPATFETWLDDHYPLRAWIIRWNSVVQFRLLQAPGNNVVVGRHNWLFYTGDKTLEDLRGRDRLTDAQLRSWRDALEGRRAWLNEHHIAYLFVVVPNKSTIHFEELPWLLRLQRQPGKMDQLFEYLRANSSVPVLDLREPLQTLKASGRPAYWQADTHWNGDGLVAAYQAIMARLTELGVAHRAADDTTWMRVEMVPRIFDCVDIIAMRGQWPASPTPAFRIQRPADLHDAVSPLCALAPWKDEPAWRQPVAYERDSGVGRAVLLCDSFFRYGGVPFDAVAQTPFLLSFRRFVSVWDRADFSMMAAMVEQEHPDVVIEQTTERFLDNFPADDPGFAQARARASAKN